MLWPKFPKPYFRIAIPRNQTSRNRTSAGYLASLLKSSGKRLKPTKLRIKLQERTLRCQLKCCSKGFKRSRYGSLHAYLPIGLAVETSQPHNRVCKNKAFYLNMVNIYFNLFKVMLLCSSIKSSRIIVQAVW